MPDQKPEAQKAGERFRDEKRDDPRPKQHGGQWHDEEQPASDSDLVSAETAADVEGSPEQQGMGKGPSTGESKRHTGSQRGTSNK